MSHQIEMQTDDQAEGLDRYITEWRIVEDIINGFFNEIDLAYTTDIYG